MKNIVFDIGNTKTKYAVFNNGELLCDGIYVNLDCETVLKLVNDTDGINGIIFSAVGELNNGIVEAVKELVSIVILAGHTTSLPCENLYKTKETLGFDRIAACIGAAEIRKNRDILVIDSGTAITYDIITSDLEYLGGLISPGINMRYKALSDYTVKLPLCEIEAETPLIGKTTRESIVGGVQNGIINEVDAYISQIKCNYPNISVFLTGGDAIFFDKKLKNSIFVHQKLLFYGLNRILEYNAEN